MTNKTEPLLFVFPMPPEIERRVPAVSGALAYYHDRALYPFVTMEIGDSPDLDPETSDLVHDAIQGRVDELGLEEWLFRGSTSKRRLDVRSFVVGVPLARIEQACKKKGWRLVLAMEEKAPAPEAVPANAGKPGKVATPAKAKAAKVTPPPPIPRPIAAKIAKIEAAATKAGKSLPPGATFDAIRAVEKTLGVELPIEVRAFYLAHDGGPADEPLFADRWLLSLDGMVRYWELCKEADEDEDDEIEADRGVRAEWWNKKWAPVTHDAGGNHEMVDLAPAKGGKVGQIVSFYHDDDSRTLEGADLLTWLGKKLAR